MIGSTKRTRGWWVAKAPDGSTSGPNHRPYCKNCAAYKNLFVEIPAGRQVFCTTECWHEYAARNDPKFIRAELLKRDRGVCASCGLDAEAFQRLVLDGKHAIERMAADRRHSGRDLPSEHNTWLAVVGATDFRRGRRRRPYESGETFIPDPADEIGGEYFRQGAYCLLTDPAAAAVFRLLTAPIDPRRPSRTVLHRMGFTRDLHDAWWDADHIIPVVEGGGELGLENFRTLCVPCHKLATAELRRRLALQRNPTGPTARAETRRQLMVPLPLEGVA